MKLNLFFRLAVFFAATLLLLDKTAASDFSIKQALIPKKVPDELEFFQKAYPDLTFFITYDTQVEDWLVTVTIPPDPDRGGHQESVRLYWAEGRLLPKEELSNKNRYTEILYEYPAEIPNREKLSKAEREKIKAEYSASNRKSSIGTPMFFFDRIYFAQSKKDIEAHMVSTTFLGRPTRVHERIYYQLKEVEKRIKACAKNDKSVKAFADGVKSSAAYNWRIIAGTTRLSFHSYGIAIDILPKKLNGKAIFWQYETGRNPDNWMAIPNSKRWIPPKKVIDIFEQEGFIWGGKWMIFDNMHFEYHPELIYFNGMEVAK